MAGLFGSDPDLAAQSSSQLAQIRDQIDPVSQWLGDTDTLGVPQVADALGEFGDTASSVTEDLTNRVGGASDLLSALASGTHEVDQSLASKLGLVSAHDGREPAGSAGAGGPGDGVEPAGSAGPGAGGPGDGGEPAGSAAAGRSAGVPDDELVPVGSAQVGGGAGSGGSGTASGGDGWDSGGGDADKDTAGRVSDIGDTLPRDSSEGNDIGPSGGQRVPRKMSNVRDVIIAMA